MAERKNQAAILRKVLLRIRRYWPALIASILMATVYVAMTLYIPVLVGQAIDCIVAAGKVDFAAMKSSLLGIGICALVAALAHVSRARAAEMIRMGMVSLNHEPLAAGDEVCDNNVTISIRGTGRFIYLGYERKTKAGRIAAQFQQYI